MYKCGAYPVIEKTAISAGIYSYEILCPEVAELAKPGQFVHIKIDGFTLRRPISICEIDHKNGSLRIVFEIRGQGTAKLTDINVGDNIDMIAPLGNGFNLPPDIHPNRRVVLVGGGIGVPPLLSVAKVMKENATAILGFRSYDKIILAGDFKQADAHVIPCTDDGSVGFHGAVTIPLAQELAKGDVDKVYACGPEPMLKAVIAECEKSLIDCEVSLEERMGCGVGACVVCACEVKQKSPSDDSAVVHTMARVCKDGPVFDGKVVVV
ncbi:MAG: dihydroorotate dehydrogenase electron transfer subunit [Oscillospiraceae bacterium]|nr:dihydroorotate dehydrogenase electron transfer subunit [Oscillospiraceae bacterium]